MTTLGSFWDRALFTWLHRTGWCSIPPFPSTCSPEREITRRQSHTTLGRQSAGTSEDGQDAMLYIFLPLYFSLSLVTCCALVLLNVCPSHRSKSCSPAPQLHGQTVQINPVTAGVNNTGIFSHLG